MVGLTQTGAATASLLLTLEGAATALIAWIVFRENVNMRVGVGMLCLVAGVAFLSWSGTPTIERLAGPLAIVGACAAWGLDNNLTRKVSLSDPLQIVQYKGLVAGPVNIAFGLWAGGALPAISTALIAAGVGFVGYGISLVLFVLALRHLGSARTSAYFSTAPFFGAIAAVAALGEPVTVGLLAAGALMGWACGCTSPSSTSTSTSTTRCCTRIRTCTTSITATRTTPRIRPASRTRMCTGMASSRMRIRTCRTCTIFTGIRELGWTADDCPRRGLISARSPPSVRSLRGQRRLPVRRLPVQALRNARTARRLRMDRDHFSPPRSMGRHRAAPRAPTCGTGRR
jgi:multidrug transporter EmrE-like cation transporter